MNSVEQTMYRDEQGQGPARVLVIEDDDALCGFLADCLELAGYRALSSNNGLDGWRAFDALRPDLVVVDLEVPVISGSRLLRLLRDGADPARLPVPVVVVTGHDMQEAMGVVAEARPDAYLRKPFAPERLLETVDWLLRQRRCVGSGEERRR